MEKTDNLNIEPTVSDTDVTEESLGTPGKSLENEQEAFRVFKTQEEFQQCLDRALGKRLSKARAQSQELNALKPVLEAAKQHFKAEDTDELLEILSAQNAQEAEENFAENSGESEDLEAQLADALRSELSNLTKNQNEFYGMQNADDLISNEQFLALLENGFEVKQALDALFTPRLLELEREKTRSEVIREIRLRGLRPEEAALSGYGSFSAAVDPRNLSDEQRAQIRERVRRGERVTF